jgi:hypothetical protein
VLSVALPAGNADCFLAALQRVGTKWAVTQRSDTTAVTAACCDLEEAYSDLGQYVTSCCVKEEAALVRQFYTDAAALEPANPLWQARFDRCCARGY